MRRILRKSRVLPLFALVLSLGLLPEVVLCVGDNGHRAFEFPGQDCCHTEAGGDADCPSPDDHCSSTCSDLRLSPDAIKSKQEVLESFTADFAKSSPALPASLSSASVARLASTAFPQRRGRSFSATPRECRTTVHLC